MDKANQLSVTAPGPPHILERIFLFLEKSDENPQFCSGVFVLARSLSFCRAGVLLNQRGQTSEDLIAGQFDPHGEQPVKFKAPKFFAPRRGGNSFYTSYCMVDGKGVLWYNDKKFYLCGRIIGPEWFE